MEQIEQNIKKALYHVQRPGRYWGNELNLSVKNREETDLSFALAFPDLYEIGMSHVGFSILYHVLNKEKWIACERVYSPWPDMEEEMLNRNIPLFSLETKTPVKEFDILGITLQYELQYTNVLNLIHLSGIPVHSSQRTSEDPIIIAGGPCSNNPEPLSMFIDVFAIGDGEEVAVEIAEKVRDAKKAGLSRKTILSNLADIPGLYVPAVHRDTGKVIKARIIEGIKEENYSEKPIVPVIDVTHDRFSMEVMRGCTRGCRFCAAGISYRPVRERDPDKAFEHARKVIENTGYEEISLVSLSTSDYSGLPRLLTLLTGRFNTNPVSIAFPSLRPETFTEEMAEIAADIRKTSLTLAPEAGTQRLRDVINKNNTEQDLLKAIDIGFKSGFKRVKLYFMIGLPTETEEDIVGIAELVRKVADRTGKYGRTDIRVSISPFSPKPHTPFQWEAQDSIDELNRKIDLLRKYMPGKGVKLTWRDPRVSYLETILGKGDLSIGSVIERAWENGVRFDAWTEMFNKNYGIWMQSFMDLNINPDNYSSAADPESTLPWDYINPGVTKSFLKKERENALKQEVTEDCRISGCNYCGLMDQKVCRDLKPSKVLVDWKESGVRIVKSEKKNKEGIIIKKARIEYKKTHAARFTSHLDTMRIFVRALRKGNIRVAYSRGFHSHPKIASGPPLPLGFTSRAEYMDIEFEEQIPSMLRKVLNNSLAPGFEVLKVKPVISKAESLNSAIKIAEYCVTFNSETAIDRIRQNIDLFLQQNKFIVTRKKKGKIKEVDVRLFVKNIRMDNHSVLLQIQTGNKGSARVMEILKPVFADSGVDFNEVDVERTGLFAEVNGELIKPIDII